MTIQMLATWNGLEEDAVVSHLSALEEARLVGLKIARDYTVGMDGRNPVLSNAEEIANQALLSGGRKSLMALGDSLTEYGVASAHPLMPSSARRLSLFPALSALNAASLFIGSTQVDAAVTTATGNGTLAWNAANQTLQWTGPGDTAGPPVDASKGGFLYVPSGTVGGIYLRVLRRVAPAVNASDAINVTGTPNNRFRSMNGFLGAWEIINGRPFETVYPFGISGAQTSDLLLCQDQWATIPSDVTVLHIGTNDVQTMADAATTFGNVQQIVALRRAIGSRVVVGAMFAVSGTLAIKRAKDRYNQLLREWCAAEGIDFFDASQLTSSTTAVIATDPVGTANQRANVFVDGLHLTGLGGYLIAKYALDPVLSKYAPKRARVYGGTPYNATLAPNGNLLTNPLLLGTAGTKSAGVTGNVPDAWRIARLTGSVATAVSTEPANASPVARTDGQPGNWWRIAIDGTGATNGDSYLVRQDSALANVAAGDRLIFSGEFRLAGTGIQRLVIWISSSVANGTVHDSESNTFLFDANGDTIQAVFESEPWTVPAGAASLNVQAIVYMNASAAITLDLAPGLCIRKA